MIENSKQFKETTPQDAVTVRIPVQDGDMIVCGTDGYFDNHFDELTNECINQALEEGQNTQKIAKNLCISAWEHSQNKQEDTPFAKEAQANGLDFTGGKKDDVTVVISLIKKINR